jgi:hypothetical protein
MLEAGIDYYLNEEGNFVFKAESHLKRGYCCKNNCKHCPWQFVENDVNDTLKRNIYGT